MTSKNFFNKITFIIATICFSVAIFVGDSSIVASADAVSYTASFEQFATTGYSNDTSNIVNFYTNNGTNFYMVSSLDEINIWDSNSVTTFGSTGPNDGEFLSASEITATSNGSLFIYDSQDRIQEFNLNGTHINTHRSIYDENLAENYFNVDTIYSLSSDLKNNVYALSYDASSADSSKVIYKSPALSYFEVAFDLSNIGHELSINSEITSSLDGKTLYISNLNGSTNLFKIEEGTFSQVTLPAEITNITEMEMDCADNLFILDSNITESKIHKLTSQNEVYESYVVVAGNALQNTKSLKIVAETGEMFIINTANNTLNKIILTNSSANFTANISGFINPTNVTDTSALSEVCKIATINSEGANLLQTPYNITPLLILPENSWVIILEENIASFEDSYFVAYSNGNAVENLVGYVLKANVTVLTPQNNPTSLRITNTFAKLYKYPTSLIFNDTSPEGLIVKDLQKEEVLTSNYNLTNYTDYNGTYFYGVEDSLGNIGYVKSSDVSLVGNLSITPTLQTNAEIIITSNDANITVYSYQNNEYITTANKLSSYDRVYVEAYSTESEWTLISYTTSSGETVSGYVQTKYIKMLDEGYNYLLAGLIFIIAICLLIVFLIRGRKINATN